MSITDWPPMERPREKLLEKGAIALSDAELLAIFLRTGVKGKTAVDLSRELLNQFGSLRELLDSTMEEFCCARGLGQAKYVQLQAVLEISKRYLAAQISGKTAFANSRAVKDFVVAQLRHKKSECFLALFLDSQHQLIRHKELFQGTIDGASVYPREVVVEALEFNAAAIIFAHNHPSGIAEPSQADLSITRRLKDALDLVDIRTLDHIVVGDREAVSFAERGWI